MRTKETVRRNARSPPVSSSMRKRKDEEEALNKVTATLEMSTSFDSLEDAARSSSSDGKGEKVIWKKGYVGAVALVLVVSLSFLGMTADEHTSDFPARRTQNIPDEEASPDTTSDPTTTTPESVVGIRQKEQGRKLCDNYDGIMFISRVIRKAGAGTMFFQSMVDSLIYSEKYNLMPFMWVNDMDNKPCYDPVVHGADPEQTFAMHPTGDISSLIGTGDMECRTDDGARPGPPNFEEVSSNHNYTLMGNGMWQSYFVPIAPAPFDEPSCQSKVVFEMSKSQVMPDMHRCSEFAVRGWACKGIPDALLPNGRPMKDWLWDSRQRASHIVAKYFRLQPWLEQKVDEANPKPQTCLAAHIRLTDKASGRDKKGLEAYQPYIEAYARATAKDASPIYIATDDAHVITTIRNEWDKSIGARVIMQQGAFRSESEKVPTFKLLENDKHRSNTEALIEIYAMAKCSFFVHGYSGMAEAVVYVNPALHNRSANIDDPDSVSGKEFEELVAKYTGSVVADVAPVESTESEKDADPDATMPKASR